VTPDATTAPVRARDVYKIFRGAEIETVALRGADLDLLAGSWTSLMGPSGSGKSTFVHIISGLLEPSGGAVFVDGEDITRLPPADRARLRRRKVGVVLQRDNLHPSLDVGANIALPMRLDGCPAAQTATRVSELLDLVGLTALRRRGIQHLSGGEAQRVSIALAVATRPVVLLTDEPTGELDDKSAHRVLDLLATVRAEGTAILTVTHNPLVAARADRRLTMQDGQVFDAA
jgi:putative ABC transport system ATP-binding protein